MITIINYKAANIKSIRNMLRKIGVDSLITDKADHHNRLLAEAFYLVGEVENKVKGSAVFARL